MSTFVESTFELIARSNNPIILFIIQASLLYPPWYQKKLAAWKRGEIDWDSGALIRARSEDDLTDLEKPKSNGDMQSLLIYLRLDNMLNTLAFVSLFGGRPGESTHPARDQRETTRSSVEEKKKPIVSIHGMRFVQLTARLGSVMSVSEANSLSAFDPVLNAFRVLGQLYNLAVSGEVAVVREDSYADSLVTRATEESSNLLLLPWTETGSLSEAPMVSKNTIERKLRSDAYSNFIAEIINGYRGASAVFMNKNFSGSLEPSPSALSQRLYAKSGRRGNITELPAVDRSHHIFMPFFGGADGQAAVRLTLQLASNPELTVTIIHYRIRSEEDSSSEESVAKITSILDGKSESPQQTKKTTIHSSS